MAMGIGKSLYLLYSSDAKFLDVESVFFGAWLTEATLWGQAGGFPIETGTQLQVSLRMWSKDGTFDGVDTNILVRDEKQAVEVTWEQYRAFVQKSLAWYDKHPKNPSRIAARK